MILVTENAEMGIIYTQVSAFMITADRKSVFVGTNDEGEVTLTETPGLYTLYTDDMTLIDEIVLKDE